MNITIQNVRDLAGATEREIASVLSQAHVAFAACEVRFEPEVKKVESEIGAAWHSILTHLGLAHDAPASAVVEAVKAQAPAQEPLKAPAEAPTEPAATEAQTEAAAPAEQAISQEDHQA